MHDIGVTIDGTLVGNTYVSNVEGETGILTYRGYNLHDLVTHATWEDVAYLLWHGELPTLVQRAALHNELVHERILTPDEEAIVRHVPMGSHGMDAIRTMVSALAACYPTANTPDERTRMEVRLTAKLPTLLTAFIRHRNGQPIVPPDPSLSHAANMLWMLHGTPPDDIATTTLNGYMVLLAENGLNISTFVACVVVSTRNDVCSAITAAIATLKGIAHGGANELAMRTFLAIGQPDHAATYIDEMVARKERMMGIGHRVFAVEDPRVRHMRQLSAQLAHRPGANGTSHAIAHAVADVIRQHPFFTTRTLYPNVEFYSAPLLYELGFPLDCFTAVFACARMPGWVAHMREQYDNRQLVRPEATYCGVADRIFIPEEER